MKESHKERPTRSSKTLLVRGRSVLLSDNGGLPSVITRCLLNQPLIDEGHPISLGEREREQIERWMGAGEIWLMRSDALKPKKDGGYEVTVTNAASRDRHVLRFDENEGGNRLRSQIDFRRDSFQPTWQVELGFEWLARLRAWADQWFAGLGRYDQIIRPHNATLLLEVTAE